MSPRTFIVKFDRPNATYLPGENITGCIIIILNEKKSVRDLKVHFKGEAYVYWTTTRTERDIHGKIVTVTDVHTATEKYFSIEQSLLRRLPENDRVELPEGQSEYYFSFQLPRNVPCSFEHEVGYIRYTAKAIVDIPWRFDWWTKSAFTVVAPFDLNPISHQCMGVDDEMSKDFCCCCINTGSIHVRIKIPSLGYVPGQFIMTEVISDVKSSNINITRISTKLEEVITFLAHGSAKREELMIQKSQDDGPIGTNHQTNLKLYVPPIPPSNLNYCSIIQLEYRLRVNVHVSGMHKKIDKKYPIFIGTIPLFSSSWTPWTQTAQDIQPTAPTIDQEPSVSNPMPVPIPGFVQPPEKVTNLPVMPQPNFNEPQSPNQPIGWDIPPPSYEECMRRANNIKDDDDSNSVYGADQPFAPRYPVFNFMLPYIKVHFKGEAHVHWSTGSENDSTLTGDHTASEKYFSIEQSLLNRSTEIVRTELPEGQSEYYFSFQLPQNIPCSFEHKIGYIRYTAKAIVDIPWRLNWWTKSAFTVVTPFDLNPVSHQCVGINEETMKDFSFCCFDKGSINVQIKIPSLGYVPGQFIMTEVISDVKSSNINVTKISTKLEEEIIFHAQSFTEKAEILVQKNHEDGPIGKHHQTNLKLYIPPLPPSNLEHCGIIELKYCLRVKVHVNGMHTKIDKKYPILIGTIPLFSSPYTSWTQVDDTQPTAPTIDYEPPMSIAIKPMPITITEPPSSVTDLSEITQSNLNEFQLTNLSIGTNIPPPSYEKCMQKADNIKDNDDTNSVYGADQPFAPRYPVFDFRNPHQSN
ncbi:arrestin domain-containing protein 17-like [Vespa mandarinia]|uniref:arrestin domain-containing protein 17-like n=1 Tax=Vespa mandarinia TaxID=7446 RepID=UPI00161BA116|nr:arrestin domain-containing protein 17-like [Vespa mandarinia]